jgi:uncharacterized membrane protein
MKKFTWLDFATLVVWLLPIFYLCTVYPSMPESVPMHYGLNGAVDRFGSKHEFIWFQLLIMGLALLVFLLFRFLPSIDPKKNVKYSAETIQKMAFGIVLFLSALNIATIFAAVHHGMKIHNLILPILGLLFAFMGNLMNNIKPNYFIGVRTPWTLESDDNWRATHRLAGKLWFIGGIVITILVLLLPPQVNQIVFISGVVVIALVPVVYSYVYFKKHQVNQNQ